MKLKIYAVYDSAVSAYMMPHFLKTTGEAVRNFQDAVLNPDSQLNKHPKDFTLFEIGEYDDSNGKLECLNTPHALATALSVKPTLPTAPEIFDMKNRVINAVEKHSERTTQ